MIEYAMAAIAFLIAMFRPVTDAQFTVLMMYSALCLYLGSKALRMALVKTSKPKDERTN
mgnify:CR=1 FL=1